MTKISITGQAESIKAELRDLEAEYEQLEQNLPPHSIKPGHLQRLEELEDLISEKIKELSALDQA
ncbi:MAG: hypothetical protein JRD68_14690 [Deltaproteobacteria bacterium]|nr:hypothetical protein [Deltaproteobacteria bacterium]